MGVQDGEHVRSHGVLVVRRLLDGVGGDPDPGVRSAGRLCGERARGRLSERGGRVSVGVDDLHVHHVAGDFEVERGVECVVLQLDGDVHVAMYLGFQGERQLQEGTLQCDLRSIRFGFTYSAGGV